MEWTDRPTFDTEPPPAGADSALVREVRQLKHLAALLLVAVVAIGWLVAHQPKPYAGPKQWDQVDCIKATLGGSPYSDEDLVEHGCLEGP